MRYAGVEGMKTETSAYTSNLDGWQEVASIIWCSVKTIRGFQLIRWIRMHLEKRRQYRDRCKVEAHKLVSADPVNSYYNAQRMAARCRCAGQADEYVHWSKIAAEIARIEPRAEMSFAKVKAINDREDARQRQSKAQTSEK
jgi:hypothetical protein